MDDSALPRNIKPVNKRQTQSLSPLSFNNFMTQKKKKQKRRSQQIDSNNEYIHEKGILHNNFLDFNKLSLASTFSNHPIAFRLVQELLLFHKPIPLIILISLLNFGLYFYRSFHFTFYSQVTFILFFYIIAQILIPQIWPIVYETLFLNDAEIEKLKEINCISKIEKLIEDESNKAPNDASNNNENDEDKKQIPQEKKEIDPRYDPKVLNHLRTPEEVSNAVFKFINPIRVFLKAFIILASDNSKEGLEIMLLIYLFFFCFTNLFDLFWPFAIFINVILLAPGIYFNPQIRRLIIGFRRRWKI